MTLPPMSISVLSPANTEELSELLRARAVAGGEPVCIVGGGTAEPRAVAGAVPSTRLLTAQLARLVDYPARDMTITLETGTSIAALQQQLAAEGQRLPIDIPQADRATLGGALAENVSGPGRLAHGTFRDYVIGIRAVDGQGRCFAAGGRVVKNVAGYDLCKLLVGSRGTLAVITEVTLKLRPLAETRRGVWATFRDWKPLEPLLAALLRSETRPVAVEVLNPAGARDVASRAGLTLPVAGPVLGIIYEGTDRETAWECAQLLRELAPHAPPELAPLAPAETGRLWEALTEFPAADPAAVALQASLPSSAMVDWLEAATQLDLALQAHALDGLAVGRMRAEAASASELVARLKQLPAERGGRAVQCRLLQSPVELAWAQRPARGAMPGRSQLAQRLKAAFDPRGLLNPHAAMP